MLSITFKNVGHGDTIILEWRNDDGENEIGIIDCHLSGGESNPALEHIKIRGYKKIQFMILTHPNTDHFSGFPSLLEFCKGQGIKIERFLHTAIYDKLIMEELADNKITDGKITLNDFIDSFVNSRKFKNRLKKLFLEINALKEDKTLKEVGFVNNTSILRLNSKLWIECLSPSDSELKEYCKEIFYLEPGKMEIRKRENNPKSNLLSIFTRISTANWSVLLPSDSTKSTIERIAADYQRLLDTTVAAIQIPNHGSLHSHFEPLWANIPGRTNIPVFVSVGLKYGLPSKEVIQFFDKNYKEVHATNFVGGFKEYFDEKYKTGKKRIEYHGSTVCGEKQIKINEDGTWRILTNP